MADISTCPALTPASILKAHEQIKSYVHQTPVLTSKSLSKIASSPDPAVFLSANPPPFSSEEHNGNTSTANGSSSSSISRTPRFNLFFKCENYQKIGAFKARGAYHAITHLISELSLPVLQQKGVITHSSGNHAQALALAASTFDIPSYIVMPAISTPSKIAGTRMYATEVIFSGSTSDEREAKVREVQAEKGAILVPPYDHPDIILGQGTAGLELEKQYQELVGDQRKRLDVVLTPLGGGGLLSGTATWFSHTAEGQGKRTLVFGTEPNFSGANDGEIGLAAQPPKRVEHVKSLTIADGLRTPVGEIPWTIIVNKKKLEGVFSVSEEEIKMALRLMMERVKVFIEPSSAVPVAVILFNKQFRELIAELQAKEGTGKAWDVGVILSGGNTTLEALSKLFGSDSESQVKSGASNGEINSRNDFKQERQMGQIGLDGQRKAEDVAG